MVRPRLWLLCVLPLSLTTVGSVAASQLTLTWGGSAGATGYSIERQAPGGSFGEIGTTIADIVTYIDATVSSDVAYCYRVRAFNSAGYSDYSNVTCGTPASNSASTFTDDFNRADAGELGNGWTQVAGTLKIKAGQVRNTPEITTHMAVQTGLVGATQSVSVSFATEGNRFGLRFGTIIRYVNSENYYLCYRRTAGVNSLRISKVVNGVEKALKTMHLAPPAKGSFFALGCQANGPMLALTLNGDVKLMTSDPTFTSGGMGFMIGYMTPAHSRQGISHIADDFIATFE